MRAVVWVADSGGRCGRGLFSALRVLSWVPAALLSCRGRDRGEQIVPNGYCRLFYLRVRGKFLRGLF